MSASIHHAVRTKSPRVLQLQIALLIILLAVASYLWMQPARTEQTLASASVEQLKETTRRNPNAVRAFHYLGLRLEEKGELSGAFDAYARAAELDPDSEADWLAAARLTDQVYGAQGAFDLLAVYLKRHPESAPAHLACAKLYARNQTNRRAWEEAIAATKSDAKLAEAWFVAGLAANQLTHLPDYESCLKQAVALEPRNWNYQMVYADALSARKKNSEANAALQAAIQLAPNEAAPYFSLGKFQLETAQTPSDREAAKSSLEHGLTLQPDFMPGHLLLGKLFIQARRWQEAKAELERARQLAPTDSAPLYELARVYQQLGDNASAESAILLHRKLQKGIQDQHSALLFQQQGLKLLAQGQPDQAYPLLQEAVKRDPNLSPAQAALAEGYLREGYPMEARNRLLDLVRKEPGNAGFWHLLGSACTNADPYQAEAEEAFRRAVTLAPDNPSFLYDYADMLAKNGKMDEAEANFRHAQKVSPKDPELLSRFGMFLALDRTGTQKHKEAESLLTDSLKSHPNDAYALYALGKLASERGEPQQAVDFLERAIHATKQIDIGELWYALYRAYLSLGDTERAQKALANVNRLRENYQQMRIAEEQLPKDPKNKALRLKLARLYAGRRENAKAISQYDAYLELNSGDQTVRRERDTLIAGLKAEGRLGSVKTYNRMVAKIGRKQ